MFRLESDQVAELKFRLLESILAPFEQRPKYRAWSSWVHGQALGGRRSLFRQPVLLLQ
jgi:hypothetical protein